jgi:hypothetical protein
MLNKEICMKCINKHRLISEYCKTSGANFLDTRTIISQWSEDDEKNWEDKYVVCENSEHILVAVISGKIPNNCKYKLEQLLKEK